MNSILKSGQLGGRQIIICVDMAHIAGKPNGGGRKYDPWKEGTVSSFVSYIANIMDKALDKVM
jgi:hypothetical protein